MARRAIALVLASVACASDGAPPAGWVERRSQGLVVSVPMEWGEPRAGEVTPPPEILGWILFRDGALQVTLWRADDVERLIDERFVRGNLQPIERRTVASPRPAVELIVGGIRWSDVTRGGGIYEARHLFVQLAPGVVGDFAVTARPLVSGRESKVTDDQRRTQDLVVRFSRYRP